MLYYAQNGLALRLGAWWWFVPPGLLIALLGWALSLVNFSIDEVINPQARERACAATARPSCEACGPLGRPDPRRHRRSRPKGVAR